MPIRSPVCAVVGHVDHGKSSILDNIRSSDIVSGEAGAITQSIGASIIPTQTIKQKCGNLLDKFNLKLNIPGLLFIDTPGHEAFTNMRKRGGSLADIAILVVDVNEGFKPQTREAIEILRSYQTPFLICANKIDLIPGYVSSNKSVIENLSSQPSSVINEFEKKMYELVGTFYEIGLKAERFDRVNDFTKELAIVPVSAKTGEGIPETLMVLSALAQKFLEQKLECNINTVAKGTILEVKEEKGLGKTLDVILYDGCLDAGDYIVIGNVGEPIVAKVRALLLPEENVEMRDKKGKFKNVKSVVAATGVKISAPGLDDVIGGMPILSTKKKEHIDDLKKQVKSEVDEVLIEKDSSGIIVKADTLGGLEALVAMLRKRDIKVMKANIGDITKKDLMEAQSNIDDPINSIVVGFNVKFNSDAQEFLAKNKDIFAMTSEIVYDIIDQLEIYQDKKRKELEQKKLDNITRPAKIQLMPGFMFRQSNPAVSGVEIMAGILKVNAPLMKEGKMITSVRSMELDKKSLSQAKKGEQIALAMDGVSFERNIHEGDILYTSINEPEFLKLKEMRNLLSSEEIEVLKEIAEIMRKQNPSWGL